jgi:hypothetical protein
VVVANDGDGPALDARLTVTDPPTTSVPVSLGAVRVGEHVVHELDVGRPGCGRSVAVTVRASDFAGFAHTTEASRVLGPVCPGPDSLTGVTGPAGSTRPPGSITVATGASTPSVPSARAWSSIATSS